MKTIKSAWGARRAALKRYRRAPSPELLSAVDRRDAEWRGVALRHLRRLRPWAHNTAEVMPSNVHPLVGAYYTVST